MSKKGKIPEPEKDLKFIDVHCHLPFHRPKNDQLPTNKEIASEKFGLNIGDKVSFIFEGKSPWR